MPFDLSFQTLPKLLYETVEPTPLKQPKLIAVSKSCLQLCCPEIQALSEKQLQQWLNGETRLPGDQRISSRYAGHQFGSWAGQLGDGRAISLGEWITPNLELQNERMPHSSPKRWELQTKGSGLTPFSRMGDGKAVIRSSVREFLCSEAMQGLGIPTTRALALLTGNDPVQRETLERSALVARVFPSNLRFGHFEYCFHFGFKAELKALIRYAHQTFFPEFTTIPAMLEEVVHRTANLIAEWQAVGFCHGVMNTDNMSFLGLTIDYGPFGFLEDTQLNHICNHSDSQGRYAYYQQPKIALWNLERLLVCFTDEVEHDELVRILGLYVPQYEKAWLCAFRKKLGLTQERESDFQLVAGLLKVLHENKIDFTFFFRCLSFYAPPSRTPGALPIGPSGNSGSGPHSTTAPHSGAEQSGSKSNPNPSGKEQWSLFWEHYPHYLDLMEWLKLYDSRLLEEKSSPPTRSETMRLTNPKYVLRNYIAEEVIRSVERDESDLLELWLGVLLSPFDEHPEMEHYSYPTAPEGKNIIVSCSS